MGVKELMEMHRSLNLKDYIERESIERAKAESGSK
jgi:hypothetical protein